MKRVAAAAVKTLIAIVSVLVLYVALKGINYGTSIIESAIKLYIDVAKSHPLESVIFYCVLAVGLLVIELITSKKTKSQNQE